MKYNSQRDALALREYGRTIHEMVNYCVTIEDRAERQLCAETIVAAMARMNPEAAQLPDGDHKLWDQLAIMSGFRLDVDYPYGPPSADDANVRPTPIKYPVHRIRFRHYGHLVEQMMRKLEEMPAGDERDALTALLADAMKQDLYDFNRDAMDNDKVSSDISLYTEGAVALPDDFEFRPITSSRITERPSRKKRRK